jgi:hypothetical protein
MANGHMSFTLPKGQYGNILIDYSGTNAALKTMTLADLGNIRLNWNGQDVVNVDAEILSILNNLYGGVAPFVSAAGANFSGQIIIPCGQWTDSMNIYDIGNTDQVQLTLDFPNLAAIANVTAGTVTVYYKDKVGVMNYLHNIVMRQVVAQGGGWVNDTFPVNNVSQIYLKTPVTNHVTDLQILKDNETHVDSTTAVAQAYSDYIHIVETATTSIAIECAESKNIMESIGGQVQYRYLFSQADTLQQYFSYILFTKQKSSESRNTSGRRLNQRQNAVQGYRR